MYTVEHAYQAGVVCKQMKKQKHGTQSKTPPGVATRRRFVQT
jgi:hypothetical protein